MYQESRQIYKFQIGFFCRESDADQGKIQFVLKGATNDFMLEYEFKDEKEGEYYYDSEPKMIKNETYGCTKFLNHKIMICHKDLVMPFTTESFECAYVRVKDPYRVWLITP